MAWAGPGMVTIQSLYGKLRLCPRPWEDTQGTWLWPGLLPPTDSSGYHKWPDVSASSYISFWVSPLLLGGGVRGSSPLPLPRLPSTRPPGASFKNSLWAGPSTGPPLPPLPGRQCQTRAGDKSSIFLVLPAGSRASPGTIGLLAALPPGTGWPGPDHAS